MGTLTINNSACNIVNYPVEYGLLYNWYAATDIRNMSSSDDWVVPTKSDFETLLNYIDDYDVESDSWLLAGGKLKETGFTHWNIPNEGATNEYGFNGVGNGFRDEYGFTDLGDNLDLWASTYFDNEGTDSGYFLAAYYDVTYSSIGGFTKWYGRSLRLLYTGAGTPTSYTGNDGKVYRVVTIGTQTFLADNLAETRFRNGDIIPWYGSNPANYFTNAEWAALTTSGVCAYDNDVNNVATGFSFPT